MIRFCSSSLSTSISDPSAISGSKFQHDRLNQNTYTSDPTEISQRLDFRIACEDDAEELLEFLNARSCISQLECAANTTMLPQKAFAYRRSDAPRISAPELLADLGAASATNRGRSRVRWLLFETPAPAEDIVAAARLKQHPSQHNTGLVDALTTAISMDIDGSEAIEIRTMLLKRLLLKAEQVAYNSNFTDGLVVQSPQWRSDIIELLEAALYTEVGGCMWPEERQQELLRPTMLFDYRKSFLDSSLAGATRVAPKDPRDCNQSTKSHPLFDLTVAPQHNVFDHTAAGSALLQELHDDVETPESHNKDYEQSIDGGVSTTNLVTLSSITAALHNWGIAVEDVAMPSDINCTPTTDSNRDDISVSTSAAIATTAVVDDDTCRNGDLDLIDRTLMQLVDGGNIFAPSTVTAAENSREVADADEQLLRTLFAALHTTYNPATP